MLLSFKNVSQGVLKFANLNIQNREHLKNAEKAVKLASKSLFSHGKASTIGLLHVSIKSGLVYANALAVTKYVLENSNSIRDKIRLKIKSELLEEAKNKNPDAAKFVLEVLSAPFSTEEEKRRVGLVINRLAAARTDKDVEEIVSKPAFNDDSSGNTAARTQANSGIENIVATNTAKAQLAYVDQSFASRRLQISDELRSRLVELLNDKLKAIDSNVNESEPPYLALRILHYYISGYNARNASGIFLSDIVDIEPVLVALEKLESVITNLEGGELFVKLSGSVRDIRDAKDREKQRKDDMSAMFGAVLDASTEKPEELVAENNTPSSQGRIIEEGAKDLAIEQANVGEDKRHNPFEATLKLLQNVEISRLPDGDIVCADPNILGKLPSDTHEFARLIDSAVSFLDFDQAENHKILDFLIREGFIKAIQDAGLDFAEYGELDDASFDSRLVNLYDKETIKSSIAFIENKLLNLKYKDEIVNFLKSKLA